MTAFIIGFIFLYTDISIQVTEITTLGLIPDFIGWFLIYRGLCLLSHMSPKFSRVKTVSLICGFLAIIAWLLDIFGVTKFFGVFSLPLLGALCAAGLIVTYRIIEGLDDIENDTNADLKAKEMYKIFPPLCVAEAIGLLVGVFGMAMLFIAFKIALLVCLIVFVGFFVQAKKGYDALPEEVKKKKEEKPDEDE